MNKHIIFNSEFIPKILDGSKTQTRRPIKPQPSKRYFPYKFENGISFWQHEECGYTTEIKPKYQVGDKVFVKETWCDDSGTVDHTQKIDTKIRYNEEEGNSNRFAWTAAALMPQWASRITLEITDVRVERLNSISMGDVKEEGIIPVKVVEDAGINIELFFVQFETLWNSIYDKKGYGWEQNPFVERYEFKINK